MFEPAKKDIKQIYRDSKKSDEFLDSFHQNLRVYVKENKPRSKVDYQKLTHHLNTIAKRAKIKGWKTSVYLKRVAEIIIYTIKGKQTEIEMDPSQNNIFDFSPLDLDEDPNKKKKLDFKRRKDRNVE
jgi:hypothetical protein